MKKDDLPMIIFITICVGLTPIGMIFEDLIFMIMGLYCFNFLLVVLIAKSHGELEEKLSPK